MVKKFKVKVNGEEFNVEVEEVVESFAMSNPSNKVTEPSATVRKTAEVSKSGEEKTVQSNTSDRGRGGDISGKKVVSAPLPGKIISVNVKKGDFVKKGDLLLILEAMKMENEIFASTDGKIVDILVSPGDYVSTGDKMIVME